MYNQETFTKITEEDISSSEFITVATTLTQTKPFSNPQSFNSNITYDKSSTNQLTSLITLDQSEKTTSCQTKTFTNTQSYNSNITFDKSSSCQLTSLITLDESEETDEDEYSIDKPIPEWSKLQYITSKALKQSLTQLNFSKIFKSANYNEINLEEIFRVKKKRFNKRTSSANWNSHLVYNTNEMSYMLLKKELNSENHMT